MLQGLRAPAIEPFDHLGVGGPRCDRNHVNAAVGVAAVAESSEFVHHGAVCPNHSPAAMIVPAPPAQIRKRRQMSSVSADWFNV